MPSGKITKKSVDGVLAGTADVFLWDDELKGFGLKVTPRNARSYIYQYRLGGRGTKTKRWTIGSHGSPWTATTARTEAERLAKLVGQGMDPVEDAKKQARDAVTLEFGAYLDTFRDGYLKTEWGSSWEQAYRQLEMHLLPSFKGMLLLAIGKPEINAVFDKLKARPALARNVWAGLSKLMNWATKQRGDLALNVMASMDPPSGATARKRVLTEDEILAMWRATHALAQPFGSFVRLLLITLQRRNEVAGIRWKEISHNEGIWCLPGERAKNGLDHLVPLSSLATAEFDSLGWKHRGLAFTTTGETAISGFSKIKARLDGLMLTELQKIEIERAEAASEAPHEITLAPWRLHDLRRTGTTRMQRLGFPIEVTERVINHHQGGSVAGLRGIYNLYEYLDEKTRALQAWADWLDQLINGAKPAPNVVPISAAAGS
ncbi:site-specific integrase [Sphingomonas sp. GC_Shp_3]|uniref:tyrosine-type recombinase/integrase n=1 Tax=Sphingomonas sp. GC_Shp_3 TaxID=2937383 RepID=UPI002269F4A4|nr:site-specific integrase [Sphingomonas sp. GC_Shp_3]